MWCQDLPDPPGRLRAALKAMGFGEQQGRAARAHKVFRSEASCLAVAAVVAALAARIAPVRPFIARGATRSMLKRGFLKLDPATVVAKARLKIK